MRAEKSVPGTSLRSGIAIALLLAAAGVLQAEPLLKRGENLRVMPVGDSITLGKDSGAGADGYRRILYEWLLEKGFPITYVGKQNLPNHGPGKTSDGAVPLHEGYGSFRTDMILGGGTAEGQKSPPLRESLETHKPDIVLLMIGTNDIIQNHELDGLEKRTSEILETIYAADPGSSVALASIAPILSEKWKEKETRVRSYNENLRAIAERFRGKGRSIVFVDIHKTLGNGKWRMAADGVHPRRLGYAHMAAAFFGALTGEQAPEVDAANPAMLPGREGSIEPDRR